MAWSPAGSLDPVWSPDSKYIAYASHLQSLYHAIFVVNVETGEKRQITARPPRWILCCGGKWAVENGGIAPDIEVENWPKEVIAGHDPQLERAVQKGLPELQHHPVQRLTKEPAPPTWGQRRIPLRSQ